MESLLQNPQLQLGDLSFLPTYITALPLHRFLAPLPRRHSRREWRRGRGEDQTEQSSPTTRRLNLTIPQLKLGVFARGSRKWKICVVRPSFPFFISHLSFDSTDPLLRLLLSRRRRF